MLGGEGVFTRGETISYRAAKSTFLRRMTVRGSLEKKKLSRGCKRGPRGRPYKNSCAVQPGQGIQEGDTYWATP